VALTKKMQELQDELQRSKNNSPLTTTPSSFLAKTNGSSNSTTDRRHEKKASLSQSEMSMVSSPAATPRSAPLRLILGGTSAATKGASTKSHPKALTKLDEFLGQTKLLANKPTAGTVSPGDADRLKWKSEASISPLVCIDSCLFESGQLCLPTELIPYTIPDDKFTGRSIVPPGDLPSSNGLSGNDSEYRSPLAIFRSHRFSSRYIDTVAGGYRSLTFSNKINPQTKMCLYELSGGSCNDDTCQSQHIRDCGLTDDELVIDMARYSEGNTPEQRQVFADMQSAKLSHLRASGIHNANLLVDSVVRNHRDFLNDGSRSIKFGERVVIKDSDEKLDLQNPQGHSGIGAIDHLLRISRSNPPREHDIPIKMEIISKRFDVSSSRFNKRYHGLYSPEDYEKQLHADGSKEEVWIDYAMSVLTQEPLSVSESDSEPIVKALHILSEALSVNPKSERLWSLYMDLYVEHDGDIETRAMFEDCLYQVPNSRLLWLRYALLCLTCYPNA